jgi:RNA-directed DNA polymerase
MWTSKPRAGHRTGKASARHRKKERFTSLLHHVSVDLLRLAFFESKRNAAPGVDGLTWQDYEADLELRLAGLHARVQLVTRIAILV